MNRKMREGGVKKTTTKISFVLNLNIVCPHTLFKVDGGTEPPLPHPGSYDTNWTQEHNTLWLNRTYYCICNRHINSVIHLM